MRISTRFFSVEVEAAGHGRYQPAFRYRIFRFVDGREDLVYESEFFRQKRDCVVKAAEHLDEFVCRHNSNTSSQSSAA